MHYVVQLVQVDLLDRLQITCSFEQKWLEVQCTYACKRIMVLIEPTLVLFLPSFSTHILTHSEIDSTHWKYSRKYSSEVSDAY